VCGAEETGSALLLGGEKCAQGVRPAEALEEHCSMDAIKRLGFVSRVQGLV